MRFAIEGGGGVCYLVSEGFEFSTKGMINVEKGTKRNSISRCECASFTFSHVCLVYYLLAF